MKSPGEEAPRRDLDGELSALGAHDLAVGPYPVPEVEALQLVETIGHRLQAEQLDLARPVAQGGERELALDPQQHDAAGDADRVAGLLPGLEVAVGRDHPGYRDGPLESVRDRRVLCHHGPVLGREVGWRRSVFLS